MHDTERPSFEPAPFSLSGSLCNSMLRHCSKLVFCLLHSSQTPTNGFSTVVTPPLPEQKRCLWNKDTRSAHVQNLEGARGAQDAQTSMHARVVPGCLCLHTLFHNVLRRRPHLTLAGAGKEQRALEHARRGSGWSPASRPSAQRSCDKICH